MRLCTYGICLVLLAAAAPSAAAQEVSREEFLGLQDRVANLEKYMEGLIPQINDATRQLAGSIDASMPWVTGQTVALDPLSRRFIRINTNAGPLLISVQKAEKIEEGVRLFFNVGNTQTGTFSDLTFSLRWGRNPPDPGSQVQPEQWRQTLHSGDYRFRGSVAPGQWNEVIIDVSPAPPGEWEYIECSVSVGQVRFPAEK